MQLPTFEVGTRFAVNEIGMGYNFVAEVTDIILHITRCEHNTLTIHYKVIHGSHPTEKTDTFCFDVNSYFHEIVKVLPKDAASILYD